MSKKRPRPDDIGPTQIMFRRTEIFPHGFKRSREEELEDVSNPRAKRMRIQSLKRGGDSIEATINKRMRYSKPSVEQTIAYLLPHIQELRSLYQKEVEINSAKSAHILDSHKLLAHEIEAKQQLISNNKTIIAAYNKVTAENHRLKRELGMMKYRLNLM
tara:strand:+ start:7374 stop:7850 length:477 start_codon:yes stop_codon:yes gene_type:complete